MIVGMPIWIGVAALGLASSAAPAHDLHVLADVASASSREYREANAVMHRDMGAALTGDADRDFVAGMIPRHEGAIAMARILLRHGRDAENHALTRAIIATQEAEIADARMADAARVDEALMGWCEPTVALALDKGRNIS